jgi:Na+/H+ antiporter NhaD/arsenite permease-like protein
VCIGGLGFIGYRSYASQLLYRNFGLTIINITLRIFSTVVANIPMMFLVLAMMPIGG